MEKATLTSTSFTDLAARWAETAGGWITVISPEEAEQWVLTLDGDTIIPHGLERHYYADTLRELLIVVGEALKAVGI